MKPKVTRPNIVLIMCDQMRGDCLSIAGHPDVKTPTLDTIAAGGTRFTNAYSACPSCIPARAALFTGQSQAKHGRVGYQDGVKWDFPNMLANVLSKNGYHTEAVGKLHAHPPLNRCGFNNLTLHDGYIGYYRNSNKPYCEHQFAHDDYLQYLKNRHGQDADVAAGGIDCNSWATHPWVYDEMSHPTNWAVTESVRFLQKRDATIPFFLMLSFVRPHPPWDAPQSYYSMYDGKELKSPAMGNWADTEQTRLHGHTYDSRFGTPDKELQRQGMAGYYSCITHMDHQIGRLLKALAQDEILEDTLLLFVSDHGEMLFDHSLFRKVVPYQGSVNIPLLVRVGENILTDQQKASSKEVVELRDIAPTILDFANIKIPPEMDGKSLKAVLYSDNDSIREYLHGEHSGGEISNHYIVTEKDKYIWFSQTGREQYFDLQNDPKEETDLIFAAEAQGRINYLRGHLIDELKNREEGYSDGEKLFAGKHAVTVLKNTV